MSTSLAPRQQRHTGIALVLWALGLFGFCGLHRFYNGRWITGLIWFLTGGFCFIGQLIDLAFIHRMTEDANAGRPVW